MGEIVRATAGRDKGKLFIVMDIIDDNYVWIVNGKNRTIDRPKKKKIRHLKAAGASDYQIREKILSGKKIFDSEISKILESFGYNE
ncbi:MAG: RNA-binding protein [Clostridiales bacterium]|nr:RNA-binding protein [Clostridiales bacterium]